MAMNVGGGASGEPEVMMDINTTPLIDVMLVLLIMLIITIPAQLHSVNLDMPLPSNAAKKVEPVVIRIDVDVASVVNWNGKPVEGRADLEAKLKEAAEEQIRLRELELRQREDEKRQKEESEEMCISLNALFNTVCSAVGEVGDGFPITQTIEILRSNFDTDKVSCSFRLF